MIVNRFLEGSIEALGIGIGAGGNFVYISCLAMVSE